MAYAWFCENCKSVVPPRGNLTPRFCPYCGARLGGAPVEGTPLTGATTTPFCRQQTSGGAIAALVCGVLALTPGLGLIMGIIALSVGASAGNRIARRRAELSGEWLAKVGMALGILGILTHIGLWRHVL